MEKRVRRLKDNEILLDSAAVCRAFEDLERDPRRQSVWRNAAVSQRTAERLLQAARSGKPSFIVRKGTAQEFAKAAGVELESLRARGTERSKIAPAMSLGTQAPELPLRFGHISQAVVEISETLTGMEFARFIWGDATDRLHPPVFRWQHEYMQFTAELPEAREPLRQLAEWFRPYSEFSRSDPRRFPRSLVLKTRLRVSNPQDEVSAVMSQQQPARPLAMTLPGAGFGLCYQPAPLGRLELRPKESMFAELKLTVGYELERREFEHLHHEALANLRASEALRNTALRATDVAQAIPVDLDVLFEGGIRHPVALKIQVTDLPDGLKDWDCDVVAVAEALTRIDEIAAERYRQHNAEQLSRLAQEYDRLRRKPPP